MNQEADRHEEEPLRALFEDSVNYENLTTNQNLEQDEEAGMEKSPHQQSFDIPIVQMHEEADRESQVNCSMKSS